ncbi:hypothetical protein CZ787_16015 [Halomonas citrativorans]|uniref:Uncharacterized protein n=1 Tax=Halomonas citrativorans TaxID=2742612 RepID=A0A1R4I475_9GAMM|nr:hypothetical protein CZ787_16015 [Halomonas citrativorans]
MLRFNKAIQPLMHAWHELFQTSSLAGAVCAKIKWHNYLNAT